MGKYINTRTEDATLTPFKRCCLENFPFIEEDFDSLTNYQLYCKVVEYLNKVIDQTNINTADVEDFKNKFIALKDYVDNFFKNLDVQDEINIKLDQMAADGTLTDIIAQYLKLAGVLVYKTVADMKKATNLDNGSICKTLGYYEVSDGGKAEYIITNTEDLTKHQEVLDNGLYATLITSDIINILQLGAKSDNTLDISPIINESINLLKNIGGTVYIPSGQYRIDNEISLPANTKAILIKGSKTYLNSYISEDNKAVFNCLANGETYNYIRFANLTVINKYDGVNKVNAFNFVKTTEAKILDNILIQSFYNNVTIKNCWNIKIDGLTSTYAKNIGLHLQDSNINNILFTNSIFAHNKELNVKIERGHSISFITCDFSNYDNKTSVYCNFCVSINFIGCYYEDTTIAAEGFYFNNCDAINFNGNWFEIYSTVANFNLINCFNSVFISFTSNYVKSDKKNETSYIIHIKDGGNQTIGDNTFININKCIYTYNANTVVNLNQTKNVTTYIEQGVGDYGYLKIDIKRDQKDICILPNPKVINFNLVNARFTGDDAFRLAGTYPGQIYFNTSRNRLNVWTGTTWLEQ